MNTRGEGTVDLGNIKLPRGSVTLDLPPQSPLVDEVAHQLLTWARDRRLYFQFESAEGKATLSINRGLEVVVVQLENLEPPPGIMRVVAKEPANAGEIERTR